MATGAPRHNFQPWVQQWFTEQVGVPTDIQCQAWPRIQAGEHVVLTAPTGSGKTLAAFLCAIDRLIANPGLCGKTRVLYVSPLKALNHDIQRNLLTPLTQLRDLYQANGESFPPIRVQTRSGDTDQSERRQMLRKPPEILITTPESLNLLLSNRNGRHLLESVQTVILDEVHAVLDSKRGAHLITAVERLPRLCGEFQRIALSATVRPLATVGEFIGGYRLENGDSPHNVKYVSRDVSLIHAVNDKKYRVDVISALDRREENGADTDNKEDFWHPLVEQFSDIIAHNHSTLLFTNSRRLCEKITFKINNAAGNRVAYSHHGSLSREIRHEVEQKLKAGELKAIVATSSLELGIDIGALDEVVLIQSPPSVSATVQRIGRAGHGVGQTSYSRLFPTYPQDFLEAAALASAVQSQDIEAIKPVRCPLDVLAQVIVSLCADEVWDRDQLHNEVRRSYSFHELPRRHFDLVIDMLSGRYADTRIRELKPRLSTDRLDNTVTATRGAVLALYMSGGTIPNRGYYQLRDANSNALIGELDEEFVWEASVGQIFSLGTQHWKVERITHNDVFVTPGNPKNSAPPFWKAEHGNRDFHLSTLIGDILAQAEEYLQSGDKEREQELVAQWQSAHSLDPAATAEMLIFLKQQREHTGAALPHHRHLVIEHINSGPGGHTGYQLALHTRWGGKVNRPVALALEEAWQKKYGAGARFYADNDCVVIQLPQEVKGADVLALVTSANIEELLKQKLEGSGFFAARFRECAGRALLLSKSKFNQRLPLWMSRLQAQKLHAAVNDFGDFPILLETWRTCLQDEFDLPNAHRCLAELAAGRIGWSETWSATPSPFARSIAWSQINQYMYMDDRTPADARSQLHGDLLRDVIHSPELRPVIEPKVLQQFLNKRQRLWPGYAPTTARDLLDWVKERVFLPLPEWRALLQAAERDTGDGEASPKPWEAELTDKLCRLRVRYGQYHTECVVSLERAPQLLAGLYPFQESSSSPADYAPKSDVALFNLDGNNTIALSPAIVDDEEQQWLSTTLLAEWLSFYGPLSIEEIAAILALPPPRLTTALDDLIDNQTLISGQLIAEAGGQQVCDAANLETLLRLQRAVSIPSFAPLPHTQLPLFIASQQGLADCDGSVDGVYRVLDTLRGYPAAAALWEQQILPARIPGYDPSWLDSLMQEGELQWLGQDKRKLSFWFDDELDLYTVDRPDGKQTAPDATTVDTEILATLQTAPHGLDFSQLLDRMSSVSGPGSVNDELANALWRLVWRSQISNDTFVSIRRGLQHRFKAAPINDSPDSRRNRPSRGQYARRHASLPYAGRWYAVDMSESGEHNDDDLLAVAERAKDRTRILLDRYGVVFRGLLHREASCFAWREVFRALRLMELSGEVLCGQFFSDIPGPQFISHEAFRKLQRPLPENRVYWLNATDPASLCGLPVDVVKASLPKRAEGTQLVYRGAEQVLISERKGKSLRISPAPNDPRLSECFAVFRERLQRRYEPDKRIVIETINDEPAIRSPYLDALRLYFDVLVDHRQVILQKRY